MVEAHGGTIEARSRGMGDDARRCREAGFLAHLTKSVDFAKLEVVIRSIADSGRVGAMLAERA